MFKTKKYLCLIGLICGIQLSLHSQQYLSPSPVAPKMLGVNQGLSQGMINCIFQDKEGYMWICTKDGLNRYDGYQIITYRHNPSDPYSLPDNYCNAIIEDDNGNFWVGTNTRGLFLFDKATENFYPVAVINNNQENLCVRTLAYEKGKLFLTTIQNAFLIDISQINKNNSRATIGNIKLLFNHNEVQTNHAYRLNTSTFTRVFFLPGNHIWASFADSIFYFSPGDTSFQWKRTALSPNSLGLENDGKNMYFFFPMPGEPENLILGYKNKIMLYNYKDRKRILEKTLSETDTSPTINIFVANGGNICRITDSFVYTFHPNSREVEVTAIKNLSLPARTISNVYTDRQNIRWFGSAGFGIAIIDPGKQLFKSFKAHQTEMFWNLPSTYMPMLSKQFRNTWEVALDKEKIYWTYQPHFAADNNHLYAYNTQKRTVKKLLGLPRGYTPVNIYIDYSDSLWIYYQDALRKNFIARVNKTQGALVASYNIPESLKSPEPFISQFFYDKDGIMWLATVGGLFAFNEKDKSWRHWKNVPGNDRSLSADGVLSICPDPIFPDKYLWIGTEGSGFNRLEKSTGDCVRYDEKNGLPNNVAYCILSDSLNNLWISTNRGLSCFDPSTKTFRNFTEEDGLPGNEFNRYISMRMQDGELMFGGVNGFVIFNPKAILQKQAAAPLVFTGVSVLNKPIYWKTDSINLAAPVGYANKLTLMPGQNIFTISFASLDFRSNAKKMYKYKLEGFDKDWTSPGSRHEVTYTNLSPGTYTLLVMGGNTDGVWNEKPISMKIVVKPFWYQTLLFKLSILLTFLAVLYGLYRFRLQQVWKLQKLRNRIARDLHDEIGSTLSSISFYAESAKKVISENQKAKNILSRINDGTSEMMEAMSDIVWAVNAGSDDFDDLANRLRSYAVQITEAKNINLHFTDNKDIPAIALDMEQRKNIYLICKEAINNAVKYANCNLLELLISKEQKLLHIQIRDNGVGFEWENVPANFSQHASGGNGLKNMKSRANEIGASLQIRSKPGNGTNITFSMPIKKS